MAEDRTKPDDARDGNDATDDEPDTEPRTGSGEDRPPPRKRARKAAEKRPVAKKSATPSRSRSGGEESSAHTARRSRPKGVQIAERAADQLGDLIGKQREGVVGLERTDDGWKVMVEVLELRRVPSTTDVLATYEVRVDGDGDLEGYRRLQRYTRGAPGEE